MTIAIALKQDGKIYFGADSFGSNNSIGRAYHTKKVMKKKDFIFTSAGSYRVINLLEHSFDPIKIKKDQDENDYIYNTICKQLIKLFFDNNILSKVNEVYNLDAIVLFAYNKRIFVMQDELSILEPKANYFCIGSGESYAEASLYTTEKLKILPKLRIKRAIECANNFVLSVNNDITIEVLS